jgi:serine/threonine-protein kinase
VLYDEHPSAPAPQGTQTTLWAVPVAGDHKPIPVLTAISADSACFSPDGRWIAYVSRESGRREVYVQGFLPDRVPAVGVGKWEISTTGGSGPRWRHDGKEIYYLAPNSKIMAVPVATTATTFQPGIPAALFQTDSRSRGYGVSPDGRFLINTQTEGPPPNTTPITVVLNWWTALKQ